jgi:cytochrome c-type biogenesis protein CcmH
VTVAFLLAAGLLLVVAVGVVAFALRPGAAPAQPEVERDAAALALRAEQLEAIDPEDPDAEALRADIERALLAETAPAAVATPRALSAATERRVRLAVLLLVPTLALGLYGLRGDLAGVQLRGGVIALERAEREERYDQARLAALVTRLEARLDAPPVAPDDRFLLGRAYMVRQEFAAAAAQFAVLRDQLGDVPGPLSYWLQARFLGAQGRLPDDARAVARGVTESDPVAPLALELLALDAFARGDVAGAGRELQRLLPLVRGTPREADIRLGLVRVAEALGSAPDTPAHAGIAAAGPDAVAGAGPEAAVAAVDVELALAPGFDAPGSAVVFVFARPPGGGPPLAARRLQVAELPLRLRLSDADAMMPGRTLSSVPQFVVMARLSSDGTPQGRAGDPVATSAPLSLQPEAGNAAAEGPVPSVSLRLGSDA